MSTVLLPPELLEFESVELELFTVLFPFPLPLLLWVAEVEPTIQIRQSRRIKGNVDTNKRLEHRGTEVLQGVDGSNWYQGGSTKLWYSLSALERIRIRKRRRVTYLMEGIDEIVD